MSTVNREPGETLVAFVRRVFCVCGSDGHEDPERLRRAVEAVARACPEFERQQQAVLPSVPGVPHLRCRIDEVSQIPGIVRRFLPEVESDPRLHALSFVDPLRLATEELGIAVSALVARIVRRELSGAVSFNPDSLNEQGLLRGLGQIRWRPKEQSDTGSVPRRG
jgi:hypothetical protein